MIDDMDCVSLSDLTVNGDDLLALGFKEGKSVGEMLSELLSLVIDDELPNEKDALLAYAAERVS